MRPDKELLIKYGKIVWERFHDYDLVKTSIISFNNNEEVKEILDYLEQNQNASKEEVRRKAINITVLRYTAKGRE